MKPEKIEIIITQESDMGALVLGLRHPFEVGEILQAFVFTNEYCEEHLGAKPGFFIPGHGMLCDIYFTTDITKEDYTKFVAQKEEELKKVVAEKEAAEIEEIRLNKMIEYIKKKDCMVG